MGAKEYLSQALWLDQRINSKLELLETLRALAMKVSVNLTEEKVSGGKNTKSHMENTIAKIVDLEKEINRDINLLGDSGIGGQRNLGKGRFVVDDCQQVPETNNRQQLVSLCVPADDDKIDKKQAQWVRRSGYTEESWHGQPNRYKDHIWAIKEKTPLDSTVKGKITMLDDTIFHYGYAMFVPEETSKSY
jgi:CRISPR type III-A-associated RAMP protein Csm4